MTKYLLLYMSPVTPQDQMANASPEEGQAGMEAWNAWAGRAGSVARRFRLADRSGRLASAPAAESSPAAVTSADSRSWRRIPRTR